MRALGLGLLLLVACSEPAPSRVERPFELRAVTPTQQPVTGLRAWLDGTLLGETKSDGMLLGKLHGLPRQRVRLSWACPAGHEPPSEQREIVLDPPAANTKQAPLKLEARCAPLEIQAALIVRAAGAPLDGLPIRVRDELVGRTDEGGLAHVLLRARRGSALTVSLDTSAHPALVPASPLETFQLGATDTILLFDRTLTKPKSKPARSKAKEPVSHVPIRIQ